MCLASAITEQRFLTPSLYLNQTLGPMNYIATFVVRFVRDAGSTEGDVELIVANVVMRNRPTILTVDPHNHQILILAHPGQPYPLCLLVHLYSKVPSRTCYHDIQLYGGPQATIYFILFHDLRPLRLIC